MKMSNGDCKLSYLIELFSIIGFLNFSLIFVYCHEL